MPRRPRRNHTPVFKSKVALATIIGQYLLYMIELLSDSDTKITIITNNS